MTFLDGFREEAPDSTLDGLQQHFGEWAEATFPHHDGGSIVDHLQEEVTELMAAYIGWESTRQRTVVEEAADVAILLLALAHTHGFSLADAIAAKHLVNKRREWGAPNSAGIAHHVGLDPRA